MEESSQGKNMDICVTSLSGSKTYWLILREADQQGQQPEVQRKALWPGNKNATEEEKKKGKGKSKSERKGTKLKIETVVQVILPSSVKKVAREIQAESEKRVNC